MRWTRCSHRMPRVGRYVLVYGPYWRDGNVSLLIERETLYHGKKKPVRERYWWGYAGNHHVDSVTHWMHLPKPPRSTAPHPKEA